MIHEILHSVRSVASVGLLQNQQFRRLTSLTYHMEAIETKNYHWK